MSPTNHVFSLCWMSNLTVYRFIPTPFVLLSPWTTVMTPLPHDLFLYLSPLQTTLRPECPPLCPGVPIAQIYSTDSLEHWVPPLFSPSAKSQLPQKLFSVNPNPSPIKWTSEASEGLLSEMLTWQVGAVSCLIPFALLNIVYFDPTAMEMFVFPLGSNRSKTLISWCVSSTSHSHRVSNMRNIFKKT